MNKYERWRKDAENDGWKSEPLCTNESIDRMAKLTKDGFVVHVDNRPVWPNGYDERGVFVWGPDGLVIEPTFPYNWESLQDGLRTCLYCDRVGIDPQRVGFAGRCCENCLPEMRKRLEYPGWTN